jgi:CheY-like chemotaxis protein
MGRLNDISVLLVDDEGDGRSALCLYLELKGARVFCRDSVEEAIDAHAAFRPDVVVADIAMPGRDGFDLIESIRALSVEDGGLTPAVAISAYGDPVSRDRALRSGYQYYMVKPLDPVAVVDAVSNLAPRGQPARRPGREKTGGRERT